MASAETVRSIAPALVTLFADVFAEAPYYEDEDDVADFAYRLRNDMRRPGFRCSVAWAGGHDDLAGFAYGYEGRPGQPYRDALADRLPPPVVEHWLKDYFEFTELAVVSRCRGHGIGERLHDSLINSVLQPRAVLTVNSAAIPAIRLYRKKGWIVIERDLDLWEGAPSQMLLGLDLTGSQRADQ
jgi:ribosomal protein S18 acetylase RimI-like enzyme